MNRRRKIGRKSKTEREREKVCICVHACLRVNVCVQRPTSRRLLIGASRPRDASRAQKAKVVVHSFLRCLNHPPTPTPPPYLLLQTYSSFTCRVPPLILVTLLIFFLISLRFSRRVSLLRFISPFFYLSYSVISCNLFILA